MTGLDNRRDLDRDHGRDHGSGSVLGLAAVAVTLALGLALVVASASAVARAEARAAADVVALAAALVARDAHALGRDTQAPACAAAQEAATANGASITHCTVADAVVTITVTVNSGPWSPSATARAGPRWAT